MCARTENPIRERYCLNNDAEVLLRLYFHGFMNVVDPRADKNANRPYLLLILSALARFRTSNLKRLGNS
jgi:hypothetical protein